MKLYLIRHGIAEELDRAGGDDAARALTREGASEVRQIAGILRERKVSPGLIMTSPATRARQTAEIVAEVLKYPRSPQETRELMYDRSIRDAARLIRAHRQQDDEVIAVGHEPHLSRLASLLLVGDDRLPLRLKKAGIIRLTIDWSGSETEARLDLVLTPKWLLP